MDRLWIWLAAFIAILSGSQVFAEDTNLPFPPREFFTVLAKTRIPAGEASCCHEARKILRNSVVISPTLAVRLFREGKIFLGDARTSTEQKGGYIFGALLFPVDKVDFMDLRPIPIPIALY